MGSDVIILKVKIFEACRRVVTFQESGYRLMTFNQLLSLINLQLQDMYVQCMCTHVTSRSVGGKRGQSTYSPSVSSCFRNDCLKKLHDNTRARGANQRWVREGGREERAMEDMARHYVLRPVMVHQTSSLPGEGRICDIVRIGRV